MDAVVVFNLETLSAVMDPTILLRVTVALLTTNAVSDIEMSPVVEGTDWCFAVVTWPVLRATVDDSS